jgi:hypothetical protein
MSKEAFEKLGGEKYFDRESQTRFGIGQTKFQYEDNGDNNQVTITFLRYEPNEFSIGLNTSFRTISSFRHFGIIRKTPKADPEILFLQKPTITNWQNIPYLSGGLGPKLNGIPPSFNPK